ncbi:hypothetical protein BLX04_12560 [Bacillus mycoides]|nr:hypothetical protein BLX04_12560 [Bacillus mycoides]
MWANNQWERTKNHWLKLHFMKAVKNHWEMIKVTLYPALTGGKPPTLKFSESKEVRWGNQLPVKARLVQLIISGDEQNPH